MTISRKKRKMPVLPQVKQICVFLTKARQTKQTRASETVSSKSTVARA